MDIHPQKDSEKTVLKLTQEQYQSAFRKAMFYSNLFGFIVLTAIVIPVMLALHWLGPWMREAGKSVREFTRDDGLAGLISGLIASAIVLPLYIPPLAAVV